MFIRQSGKSSYLTVGTAQVDITPNTGSMMAAFPRGISEPLPRRKARRAKGVHDPLKAKATVLSDKEQTICLCSCDLTGIRRADVEKIRKLVSRQIPELSGSRIIVAATHTHSSAETLYIFGNTPDNSWIDEMDCRIAEAIVQASQTRVPVSVGVGKGQLDLAFNRRVKDKDHIVKLQHEYEEGKPTGLFDPELVVIRFEKETGGTEVVLASYTAHPLTVGPGNFLYSADYPGVACFFVEKSFPGATGVFFNGAAGDIHPRHCWRPDFEAMEEVGGIVGRKIVRVAEHVSQINDTSLRFCSDVLTFPNRVDPTLRVDVELSCVALGSLVMGFVPGEVFVQFQLTFKEKMLNIATPVFVGYANGWPGYIPTEEAYKSGGYGVELWTTDPPQYSRTALPKGAGEEIMDKLLAMAMSLYPSKRGL